MGLKSAARGFESFEAPAWPAVARLSWPVALPAAPGHDWTEYGIKKEIAIRLSLLKLRETVL